MLIPKITRIMISEKAFTCHICNGKCESIEIPRKIGFVSSDCQPLGTGAKLCVCRTCGTTQKSLNKEWFLATEKIYENYNIYSQSNGSEQVSYQMETGSCNARSSILAQWLNEKIKISDDENAALLDIGCGNGAFLQEMAARRNNFSLFGQEVNTKNRSKIEAIKNTSFTEKTINQIDKEFDIISMIHVLEHIPNPLKFLKAARNKLKINGALLIQVPNLEESPFDLLIFDHCTHFNQRSLSNLLMSAGFKIDHISKEVINREISIIASKDINKISSKKNESDWTTAYWQTTANLKLILQTRETAIKRQRKFAIFGSSISATWLAQEVEYQVEAFIDEDSNKVGNSHCGIPIKNIEDIDDRIPIIMPFNSRTAKLISERLGKKFPKKVFIVID